MKFNNKLIYLIIVTLVILDIFLLFRGVKKEVIISELEQRVTYLENSKNNYNILSEVNSKPFEIVNKGNYEPTIKLITFLSEDVCGTCLETEIKFLNKINSNYSRYLRVYYQGNPDYLKDFQPEFNIEILDSVKSKFNLPIAIDNPVSLIVDKNGYVHSIHKAINGKAEISKNYFKSVTFLFNAIYKNN